MSCIESMFVEKGGNIELNRFWAYSLLKSMKIHQGKVTTTKRRYSPVEFRKMNKEFLKELAHKVEMEEIPPKLILKWDKTATKNVHSNM